MESLADTVQIVSKLFKREAEQQGLQKFIKAEPILKMFPTTLHRSSQSHDCNLKKSKPKNAHDQCQQPGWGLEGRFQEHEECRSPQGQRVEVREEAQDVYEVLKA